MPTLPGSEELYNKLAGVGWTPGEVAEGDQSIIHLPLPGVAADAALTPRGLEVEVLSPSGSAEDA